MASAVDLDRVSRNDDRLTTLQLILSGAALDLETLKVVLRLNTKVSEVIIYVDESFLVDLPVHQVRDLFLTIGGMPNLQKLGFHSQSGSSGVLTVAALVAVISRAARLVNFGISDVALAGTMSDFCNWAHQMQSQVFLKSFCLCECELFESVDVIKCPLDPLLTVLSILPSLEALFVQAASSDALGHLTPEAVGAICMAPKLQDLRIGNFELLDAHIQSMSVVLEFNRNLSELKLDCCVEFSLPSAIAMAKMLQHNQGLTCLEVGLARMIADECAIPVARALEHNTKLQSLTLTGGDPRRQAISKPVQAAFVEMLHKNYSLETLVLFQRFPVKKEFKIFLTLNKFGRGPLLRSHSTTREQWIQALVRVIDDMDSIFYYLSINPSLCYTQDAMRPGEVEAGHYGVTQDAVEQARQIRPSAGDDARTSTAVAGSDPKKKSKPKQVLTQALISSFRKRKREASSDEEEDRDDEEDEDNVAVADANEYQAQQRQQFHDLRSTRRGPPPSLPREHRHLLPPGDPHSGRNNKRPTQRRRK